MPLLKPTDYPFWFRLVVLATLALFAINIFFFLGPMIALITAIQSAITIGGLIAGVGTLAATFAGAWLAFKFATLKSERDRVNDEVAAGNRALFTLTWMWNETKEHQKEVVEPYRGKPDAWLNLSMSHPFNADLSFDMKDLSFVMQTNAGVFQKVFLEEERFRIISYLIEDRRRLLLTQTWPRLEAAGISIGMGRSEVDIHKILGSALVKQLKITTAAVINFTDENVTSLRDVFRALRTELKKIYPDEKFINYDFSG